MNNSLKTKKTINFLGVMIPVNKRLLIGLTYIYGIGLSTSNCICYNLNLDKNLKVKNVTPSQFKEIKQFIIWNGFLTGADKKRLESNQINRLISIKCYRGVKWNKQFRKKN